MPNTDLEIIQKAMRDFVTIQEYMLVAKEEGATKLAAYNEVSEHKIDYLVPHMLRHSGATRNAENG